MNERTTEGERERDCTRGRRINWIPVRIETKLHSVRRRLTSPTVHSDLHEAENERIEERIGQGSLILLYPDECAEQLCDRLSSLAQA